MRPAGAGPLGCRRLLGGLAFEQPPSFSGQWFIKRKRVAVVRGMGGRTSVAPEAECTRH